MAGNVNVIAVQYHIHYQKRNNMKKIKNLGRKPIGKQGRTAPYSLYKCPTCNEEFEALDWHVNSGATTQCNKCGKKLRTEKIVKFNKTHGKTNTPLFKKWNAMMFRCYGKTESKTHHNNYKNKSVTVCNEWHNFEVFEKWALSNGYKEGLDIDKDKKCKELNISPKIYSPKTCIFVTPSENTKIRNEEHGNPVYQRWK